jgi:hypothetical protein
LILLTSAATDQNTVEQREDRPRQKASVRLAAQDKRANRVANPTKIFDTALSPMVANPASEHFQNWQGLLLYLESRDDGWNLVA